MRTALCSYQLLLLQHIMQHNGRADAVHRMQAACGSACKQYVRLAFRIGESHSIAVSALPVCMPLQMTVPGNVPFACRFGRGVGNSILTTLSVICVDFVGIGVMWATICWYAAGHLELQSCLTC